MDFANDPSVHKPTTETSIYLLDSVDTLMQANTGRENTWQKPEVYLVEVFTCILAPVFPDAVPALFLLHVPVVSPFPHTCNRYQYGPY